MKKSLLIAVFIGLAGIVTSCNQADKSTTAEQFALCEGSARVAFMIVSDLSTNENLTPSAKSSIDDYEKNCASFWELHKQRQKEVMATLTEQADGENIGKFSNMVYYKTPKTDVESVAGQIKLQDGTGKISFSYLLSADGRTWVISGGSIQSEIESYWENLETEMEDVK